jgi:uncharacterized protein (DUF779 family)
MMTQDFNKDFDYLFNRIFVEKSPTVFARYADGELAVITGQKIRGIDNWQTPDYKTKLGVDLGNTLKNNHDDWFYGISCSCCDERAHKIYINNLLNRSKVKLDHITYSNLWVNGNYSKFKQSVESLQESVVVIANKLGVDKKYPFQVEKFYPIETDCISLWETEKEQFLDDMYSKLSGYNNTLFFVSAGPLSEVIIEFLWNKNKSNRYIDVGSALDEYTKGCKTRSYMFENQLYYNKNCQF